MAALTSLYSCVPSRHFWYPRWHSCNFHTQIRRAHVLQQWRSKQCHSAGTARTDENIAQKSTVSDLLQHESRKPASDVVDHGRLVVVECPSDPTVKVFKWPKCSNVQETELSKCSNVIMTKLSISDVGSCLAQRRFSAKQTVESIHRPIYTLRPSNAYT